MLNKLPKTTAFLTLLALINCSFVAAATEADSKNQATTQSENTQDQTSSINTTSDAVASTPVERSQFTTAVVNREPTDNVITLTNNSDKIYFFSELSNLKGHTITHRWQYQGKLMAEIKFDVKSNRWRVFSSKNIRPDWIGKWTVELTDENGTRLNIENLQIVDAKSN